MKRYKRIRTAVGLLLFVISAMLVTAGNANVQTTKEPSWPVLQSGQLLDSAEVAAIEQVIEHSYTVLGYASKTFDLSEFPTVFANDSAVPFNKEQADYLSRVEAIYKTGWLDYKIAFFEDWKWGAEGLEQLEARAKSESRGVTAEELRSIVGTGMHPAPRSQRPVRNVNIRIESLTIDGERAEVVYDNGAQTKLVALLKTENGWRIVGERILDVHV